MSASWITEFPWCDKVWKALRPWQGLGIMLHQAFKEDFKRLSALQLQITPTFKTRWLEMFVFLMHTCIHFVSPASSHQLLFFFYLYGCREVLLGISWSHFYQLLLLSLQPRPDSRSLFICRFSSSFVGLLHPGNNDVRSGFPQILSSSSDTIQRKTLKNCHGYHGKV